MDAEAPSAWPMARPPRSGRLPRRETLRLDDGTAVSVYLHEPLGPPRRPVVYLHGIQSHPGWFVASAAELAAAGHPVVQVTRRGSGDSDAGRGDARSTQQVLDDVAAACRFALRDGADGVHLAGVSWGGKLAACFAAAGAAGLPLRSLTLIAAGIVPQVDVPARTKLAVAASLLCCPRRRFDIPLSDPALFTDNEPMRQFLRDDPWRLHQATARFLYVSSRLDAMLRRRSGGCLDVPTTLILSDRDRIIDNEATLAVARYLAGDRLEVHELSGAHTLEFEPDPQPFYDVLLDAVSLAE